MKKEHLLAGIAFGILMTLAIGLSSQTVTLTFTAKDGANHYAKLNRVVIANLTRNWQETIYWPDTVLTMQNGTGIDDHTSNGAFSLSQNNPNPFSGTTDVTLTVVDEGKVNLDITDMHGHIIEAFRETSLCSGNHQFRISLSTPGTYVMTARQNRKTSSIKMICNGGGESNAIDYLGETLNFTYVLKSSTNKPFQFGDQMKYWGYATINGTEVESEHIIQMQECSQTFTLQFASIGYHLPWVTTNDVSNIYGTSATCGGYVSSDHGHFVTARGVCWDTSQNPTINNSHTVDGNGLGSFTSSIFGLAGNTTYYVRAYATNAEGTAYGEQKSFNTQVVLPQVTTNSVSNITTTTATCGGNVTSDGGATVTARGVCWGTSISPSLSSHYTTDGSGTGSFTSNLTNLMPNTTYYVRAYATNSKGTHYGETRNFTTAPIALTVITNLVTYIEDTSARCSGSFNTGAVATDCGICWSATQNPTLNNNHVSCVNSSGNFGVTISALTPNTTYYVRAYATNSDGTVYGNEVSFTTSLGPCSGTPVVIDIDGNSYSTVQIGNQCWMREDLKVTKYSDGMALSSMDYNTFCNNHAYYYNHAYYFASYNLYNWAAATRMTSSDASNPFSVKGICPDGWHLPNDNEWNILIDYVSSQSLYCCSNDSNYIAKALASTSNYWNSSSTSCAVGNGREFNNSTGFSAGGSRPYCLHYNSPHFHDGEVMYWGATQSNSTGATTFFISSDSPIVHLYDYVDKSRGCKVRCIRNADTITYPTVTTLPVSRRSATSISCAGNVADDGNAMVTERGFCYSTTQNPTVLGSHRIVGSDTGHFTINIAGLTPNTMYYVRAYAYNLAGFSYGNQETIHICGTDSLVDYDGNTYSTIEIGNQCWMKKNMCCTHYPNGTSIPGLSSSSNGKYSWQTANSVCPDGWHLPSDSAWIYLLNYVKGQNQYICGDNSSQIAKSLASTSSWSSSTTTCAVGNNLSNNNATGFAVEPNSTILGSTYGFERARFWTATSSGTNARYCSFDYNNAAVTRGATSANERYSVRCLRNETGGEGTAALPTVTTDSVSNITLTSAICGGNATAAFGVTITARGICWSTSQNPTVSNSHTTNGSGTGSFTSSITGLTAGTTYYVRAYATNSAGTAYGAQRSFRVPSFICDTSTVIDHEGNVYNTVQIGSQCWTKENLRTTTSPSTGTNLIPASGTDNTYTGKQARWYNNDSIMYAPMNYGLLYNWNAAVDTFNTAYGETSVNQSYSNAVSVSFTGHRRGICPAGWHLPSEAEWTLLTDYVSSQSQYVCSGNSADIAKALASTTGWNSSSGTCAVGNHLSANNATGFSAVPAGYCNGISFSSVGYYAYFWSSSHYATRSAYNRYLNYFETDVHQDYRQKDVGYSVRCLRDETSGSTANLPTVTTNVVSDITVTSAMCGGNVTADGGAAITIRGVCWSTSPNPTVSNSHTTNGGGTGNFTSSITGLTAGTTYYVRAYAANSAGTAYGEQRSYTTSDALPTVTTNAVTNIATTSATFGGDVTSDGGATVIARGVCWSTSQNPTVSDNHTIDGSGMGSFNRIIMGLISNTTYYVRAYATNSAGTAYGNEVSFTTTSINSSPQDGQPCPATPMVTDHEGNVYNTVQIGNQCWTKENLRTMTSPSTGTNLIPASGTGYTFTGKQARWHNNDSTTYAPMNYGLLYNWNAAVDTFKTAYGETSVNTSSSNAVSVNFSGHRRGICPAGWHLPSNAEWTQLKDYVSSQSQYVCGSDSTKIAKSLASTTGWNNSINTCAVGNNLSANNATGFSAVPAGYHSQSFENVGENAYFWSSSQSERYPDLASIRSLSYFRAYMVLNDPIKMCGYPVRCLCDETGGAVNTAIMPSVTTNAISDITATSAICGGNVTDDGIATVTVRGVCWSTSPNPTVSNSHTTNGSGMGAFTSGIMGLAANTLYYVRAYATNSQGTAYGEQRSFTTASSVSSFICGTSTVIDHDGNIYNTVQIGNQCWTKENLRTTTSPSTGTNLIPASGTGYTYTGKQARWYNDDPTTYAPMNYGLLYNWNAAMDTFNKAYGETSVNTSSSNAVSVSFTGYRRGICPMGWHLPSDAEWTQLTDYVSSQNQYVCGSNSNNIAKALASNTGWNGSDSTCAVGNNLSANNATGFSAVPAGRCAGSSFGHVGGADFFSSSQLYAGSQIAYVRCLYYDYAYVQGGGDYKCRGYSVRCLRNDTGGSTAISPTVTTNTVDSITATSATCGGNVSADGGATVTARGVCWSTSQYPTVDNSHTTDGSGMGGFTSSITGLTAGITYYVRAYATNSAGTSYGEQRSFTTSITTPTVTTNTVSNITATSATCGGNVTVDGGAMVTARGVCWSTFQNPTVSNTHTTDGSGTGSFTSSITGLTVGTTYYVRAYATNGAGTTYGAQRSFTTPSFTCGFSTVTDHEGNVYNTVQIGNQCWTKENLRTTTSPSTGTSLIPPSGTDKTYTGKQARWYNNDSTTYAPMNYGLLYNWNAAVDTFNTAYGETSVNTSSNNAVSVSFTGRRRGICPVGWHLPSDSEWTQLTDYVSSQTQYICGSNCANIAKALASTTGWDSSSSTCAVGNDLSANNATGFSAVPAGSCEGTSFNNVGKYAYFFSSSSQNEGNLHYAYRHSLGNNSVAVSNGYALKNSGFTVRCLRDETGGGTATLPTVITNAVGDITAISAMCGGNVTDDGGAMVTAKGVCWNTSQNPTVINGHTTNGSDTGTFTSGIMGLTANTMYYVRAYATNNAGTAYGAQRSFTTTSSVPSFICGTSTVIDHEGNVYNTVQIGNQCWTKENLRTMTSPSTGTNILLASGTGYTCTGKQARWYLNDAATYAPMNYGLLYNWNAAVDTFNTAYGETSVNTSLSNAVSVNFTGHRRGICPAGWHLPSDSEWTQLTDYVSSQNQYVCGGDITNMAKALASTIGWNSSSSACAVGNDLSANNATGFSAVPAGFCNGTVFSNVGKYAHFGSSSQNNAGNVINVYECTLFYNDAYVHRSYYGSKNHGYSVRCVKD